MKYRKTFDLWATGNQDWLLSGRLVLQRGQWCQCGAGKKCRFVGITESGSIWVAHWQGNAKDTAKRFKDMVANFKKRGNK